MAKLPASVKPAQKKKVPGTKAYIDEVTAAYNESFISTRDFFIAPGRKNHLLEHYMPGPGTVTAIVAPPGGGKTTLLTNLAFRFAFKKRYSQKQIAHDEFETEFGDFLGLRMTQKPGPVLFIAREGHRQMQLLGAHFNELMHGPTLADAEYFEPIVVMADTETPKLDDPLSFERLKFMLATFEAMHGRPPAMIILDTARKLLAGDENSSGDVSRFMQACQTMAKECKAAVIVAHHTPKSEAPTARGSGAWLADADCEWQLKPNTTDKKVTVTVSKLKGFQLPPSMYFTIKPVDTLLPDEDNPGKVLSAAHIEVAAAPKKKVNESAEVGDAATKNLLASPEAKHAARQAERIRTMQGAWEEAGREYAGNGNQYISRAALAAHLIETLGYTAKTAQQALKPAANPGNKGNIVGPLLTDGLIEPIEHGWIIVAAAEAAPDPTANKIDIKKEIPKKKKPLPFPRKKA